MSRGGRGGRGGLTSVNAFFNEPAFNNQMQNSYSSRPNTRSSMGRMQQSPQQQLPPPPQMPPVPDPPQIIFATPKADETPIPGLFTGNDVKESVPENQTSENGADVAMDQSTDNIISSPKKPKKFIPGRRGNFIGGKVSKHIMKRRQNARLRTILTPKNSMMVLYELHPELKLTISEEVSATNQMTYTVKIEIDGRSFVGQGMSKAAAKQAASENALKAVLLEKLEQNNVRLSSASNTPVASEDAEMPLAPQSQDGEAAPKVEGEQVDGSEHEAIKKPKKRIPEDDVPWGSLASFALYKLFSEWQSQGFQLPANAGISGIFQKSVAPAPSAAVVPKKLPPDANQKHPVQLLNQVRPGSQYIESREGVPPNLTFTFTVIVDGKTYKGTGTNKKEAKKQCAKSVLEAMGVVYD